MACAAAAARPLALTRGWALLAPRVAAPHLAAVPRLERRRAAAAVTPVAGGAATPAQGNQSQPSTSTGSTSAVSVADGEAPVPALPPAGAYAVNYRGPIEEDLHGGARLASVVESFWSNIPSHVRSSFQRHGTVDAAPRASAPMMLDGVAARARALAAGVGLAPAWWARPTDGDAAAYYDGKIPLAPYRRGQTAAYNYPRMLVPRQAAIRFPMDMKVDPVFQTSDPTKVFQMSRIDLYPRFQGHATLLMIFSGQPLSGLWTGLQQWMDSVGEELAHLPKFQVFKMHCQEGFFNRRTHQLTKFQLRRQVNESEQFTTFVYRGKWKSEYVHALHLYNRELPVVLLLDQLGYIRWHAVGLPSDDAIAVFNDVAPRLAREKRSHA